MITSAFSRKNETTQGPLMLLKPQFQRNSTRHLSSLWFQVSLGHFFQSYLLYRKQSPTKKTGLNPLHDSEAYLLHNSFSKNVVHRVVPSYKHSVPRIHPLFSWQTTVTNPWRLSHIWCLGPLSYGSSYNSDGWYLEPRNLARLSSIAAS